MSYSAEVFQRALQTALNAILNQQHWGVNFKDSLCIQEPKKTLLDRSNITTKCPCLMTHALSFPEKPVKKRKRKRRKKRKSSRRYDEFSVLHSFRYI